MTGELLALAWRATVAVNLVVIVILVIRRPLRMTVGCRVAYGTWLAVPICTCAALLPAPVQAVWTPPIVIGGYVAAPAALVTTAATTSVWPTAVMMAWALGAVLMAAWQVHLQRAFTRSLGVLVVTGDMAVSSSLEVGPVLVGLFRPVIVVPADFRQRYTAHEQRLVVAHERAHARHGDTFVNAFCAGLRCLWWFDPLVHVAARLVRRDQELARDTEVVRAHPRSRRAYAAALLKAHCPASESSIDCHWRSRHPLKERILNLTRHPPAAVRRLGTIVVASAMFGGSYATWAAQGAAEPDPGRLDHARWTNATPTEVVTVERVPGRRRFRISAVITDLATSRVLATPRLLTAAGTTATIEIGSEQVGFKLGVVVAPSGRAAEYTFDVLRDGKVESSRTVTLAVPGPGLTEAPGEDEARDVVDGRPVAFRLSFSSSNAKELACAADALAARGDARQARAMRLPADGKVHMAEYAGTASSIDEDVEPLIAALSKCQLGVDSNLSWSTRPADEKAP